MTVAAANFPESQVLAEIYALALEGAGITVERQDPIGSREAYYAAIESNEIQLIPEYTNSLLSFVLRQADPNVYSLPDTARRVALSIAEFWANARDVEA